jgi:hypothetical protein
MFTTLGYKITHIRDKGIVLEGPDTSVSIMDFAHADIKTIILLKIAVYSLTF